MTGRISFTPEAERQLNELDDWITKAAPLTSLGDSCRQGRPHSAKSRSIRTRADDSVSQR